MRDILFRGKRKDNREWVYGYVYRIWERVYILWGMTNDVPNMIEVDPETVGQYTGLTDKNGKKIFEGDVVYSIYSKKNYPVLFGEYTYIDDYGDEQGACGWYNEEGDYSTAFGNPEEWAEVIGNIHDNPELL